MNELDKILEGLATRTNDGKLKWSPSAISNEFVTSINAISIAIQELRTVGSILRSKGEYRLTIFDESGKEIEFLETVNEDRVEIRRAEQLADLYILARRSALNTQATLEKLAKALET